MSVYQNSYEGSNSPPTADAWCVYEIDPDSDTGNPNPKILDGYGISSVQKVKNGVHRVHFTHPEKVASGGYVVLCGSELGNAPSGYGIAVVHGTTANFGPTASGASASFDLAIVGFNAGSSTAPSFLTDSSYTFKNRVNLAVFCLRSDAELRKTRIQNLIPSVFKTDSTEVSGSGGLWGVSRKAQDASRATVTLQENAVIAPDGTQTATAVKVTGIGRKVIQYSVPTVTTNAGKVFTRSVYVKSARPGYNLRILDNGMNTVGSPILGFNPITGATTGSPDFSANTNYRAHTVQSVGNGWWRVSLSMIGDLADGSVNFYLNPHEGTAYSNTTTGENDWTGDGGDYLYLWGAQLEEGLVATPLIDTPVPPKDGNQDLLLRSFVRGNGFGQMTYQNLLTNTENSASWLKSNVGISAGYTAPDGTTTAFKIWEHQTAINIYKSAYLGQNNVNGGHTAGGHRPTTFSFYAKADERRYVRLVDSNSFSYGNFVVDLQSGRVVANNNSIDSRIDYAGDGWWKIAVTAPRRSLTSNGYSNFGGVAPAVDPISDDGALGDGYGSRHPGVSGNGILVWHGQINHGTVYGDYIRSDASVVGTTFSRVLGATYTSVSSNVHSGGAATAWGTIVVPANPGTSTPVIAYLENSCGVGSITASGNNTFNVLFSSPMSTDTYCVITSIETETVHLPESGVGTAGSIPTTDEFVLPIMRGTTDDAQRKRSGFTIRCLRQEPTTNIFSEQSIHHQRGRQFKIHFMVFGGRLTYGAG